MQRNIFALTLFLASTVTAMGAEPGVLEYNTEYSLGFVGNYGTVALYFAPTEDTSCKEQPFLSFIEMLPRKGYVTFESCDQHHQRVCIAKREDMLDKECVVVER